MEVVTIIAIDVPTGRTNEVRGMGGTAADSNLLFFR
jgi:hypothetical protein